MSCATFSAARAAWSTFGVVGALLAAVSGCANRVVPDPQVAAQRYSQALKAGDADAVYAMMTQQSKRRYGHAEVRRLVEDNRRELSSLGSAFESGGRDVEARSTLRYSSGLVAEFSISNGEFFIDSAGALPARAGSPAQALGELRDVLQRRSFLGLLRILSDDTRSTLEHDITSLARALEEPEALEIVLSGDHATVTTADGHWVELRREHGIWRVHDFH